MINRKPLIVLAVLAALSSASAFAVDTPPPGDAGPQHGLARLDTNGDGVVDRAEAAKAPRLAQGFDKLDKNKDGKLSADELPKRGDHRRGGHDFMAKLDTNKDGRVSREEAKAEPKFAERFDKMDVNKDGFVDKADFAARMKERGDAWFAAADADKDGKLSKAEFDAAMSKRPPFGPRGEHGPRGDHGRDHGKPQGAPAAAK